MSLWLVFVLVLYVCVCCHGANRLLTFTHPEQYLDICLDGISHKSKPGPESNLFQMCSPWKDRSCCTETIAQQIHVNQSWYKLDYNHCPQRQMSQKCRSRFVQDLCFYECSPNVGPWLVKVEGMKIRNERFLQVPLCQTECNAWWEDCQEDYTCIQNWSKEFNWQTGFPECPEKSLCRPMKEVYENASHFCETVFDHSWKVVADDTPSGCFLMWWEDGENPNTNIALEKARSIVSSANQQLYSMFIHLSALCLCVFSLRNMLR